MKTVKMLFITLKLFKLLKQDTTQKILTGNKCISY